MTKGYFFAEDLLAILAGVDNPREGMKTLSVNMICRGYAQLGARVDGVLKERVSGAVEQALSLAGKCSDGSMATYVGITRCVLSLPQGAQLIDTEEVQQMLSAYFKCTKK